MVLILSIMIIFMLLGFVPASSLGNPAATIVAFQEVERLRAGPETQATEEAEDDDPFDDEDPEQILKILNIDDSVSIARDAQIAGEVRFQKQCFLSYNMLRIHQKMTNTTTSGTPQTSGRQPVTPFYHATISGASPADITSLFVSRPDVQDLLNVKPYLLSYFMPYVRIYKVFGDGRVDQEDNSRSRYEGQEVEFVFEDHIRQEQIENILATRKGRAGGVGLKSVNWQFLGTTPAEVENNIQLNLKIYFNDINEFERLREDPNRPSLKYRFSDLVIHEPIYNINANQPGFNTYNRVFNPNHFRLKIVTGWNFLPSVSGNEGIFSEITSEDNVDLDKLRRTIRDTRKVMYVTLTKHNISFSQDGSIELSADYQAMVEGVFSSPFSDILNVRAERQSILEQLEDTEAALRQIQDLRGRGCFNNAESGQLFDQESRAADADYVANVARERRTTLRAQRAIERDRDKAAAYQSIMRRLMLSGRVYTCNVRNENLGFSSSFDPTRSEEDTNSEADESVVTTGEVSAAVAAYAEEQGNVQVIPGEEGSMLADIQTELNVGREGIETEDLRRAIAVERAFGASEFEIANDFSPGMAYSPEQQTSAIAGNNYAEFGGGILGPSLYLMLEADEGTTDTMYENAAAQAQQLVQLGPNPGTMPIEFMFFGDILDVVLGPVKDWLEGDNVEIILGTFLYRDPSGRTGEDEPVPVPIGHIPISTELFSMWFLEEIVSPKKTTMTLRSFVRSVFDKLIINAFGSDCVYDPSGQFTLIQEGLTVVPEFYTIHKNRLRRARLDRLENNRRRLSSPSRNTRPYSSVRRRTLGRGDGLLDNVAAADFNDYKNIVLYQHQTQDYERGQVFERDIGRQGYMQVYQEDSEIGVYHLNLGSDRGLVKKIEFKRMDQDYGPEARMAAAGELNQFDQLRERYNATVTMYGNSLFYPGQHVYINPSTVGLGSEVSASALSTKLGIGGYFVIVRVENIIESGLFETILDCRWVTSGFGRMGFSGQRGCTDRNNGDEALRNLQLSIFTEEQQEELDRRSREIEERYNQNLQASQARAREASPTIREAGEIQRQQGFGTETGNEAVDTWRFR